MDIITGKAVRELRNRLNLDCAEFAKELGTTATVVARWEDGAELDCEDQYCGACRVVWYHQRIPSRVERLMLITPHQSWCGVVLYSSCG